MSDKPDNPNPEPRNSAEEEFEIPSEPEQIWPPPDAPSPTSPENTGAAEVDWSKEADRVDEAVAQSRRSEGEPEGAPTGEEEPVGVSAMTSAEEMVAGKVGAKPEPPAAIVSEAAYRVRQQSEAELGQLWGNIFFSVEGTSPRAIIVTAARRRDGATQIAIALALIGAEAGPERRIALVDFNLRNPAVAEMLGIKSEPGLTDVLDGRIPLEAAIHALRLPNGNLLHVLPAGLPADRPLGLLKSRQAQALIARLKDRYDHAIIDITTPNTHPDPQIIGSQVDGALLVARAGQTPRETIAEAKKRLDIAGIRCLGLVLNQRSDPIPDFLYNRT